MTEKLTFKVGAKLIVTTRAQASSIASWAACKGCTQAEAAALIQAYAAQVATYKADYTVDFDKMVAAPTTELAALAAWLDVPSGDAHTLVDPSWKRF